MATITKLSLQLILEHTFWKFITNKRINENYDEFYNAVLDDPSVFVYKFPKEYKTESDTFVENMKNRITSSDVSVKQEFILIVYDVGALSKIKYILTNNIDDTCSIEYISAPKYQISSTGQNTDICKKNINNISNILSENIKNIKCKLTMVDEQNVSKNKRNILKPLHQ